MMELRDLYQEVILDHNKQPRNFGVIAEAEHMAVGHNPLCGDQIQVYLELEDDRISDVKFDGSGCAISTASASLMTEAVKGRPVGEAEAMFKDFHELLTGDPSIVAEVGPQLGKLAVFSGVREFPVRVKCATLAWHTLRAALYDRQELVTTE